MSRLARCLLFGVTAFSLALLGFAFSRSLQGAEAHRWSQLGYDWLKWDLLSQQFPWKPAAIAGAVAIGIAAFVLARSKDGGAMEGLVRLFGNVFVALFATVAAVLGPRLLAGSTQPTAPPGSPNVLCVLVDTWRADHAGFLGYEREVSPNLDRLAEEAVVFEHAQAVTGWTKPSVATLLTGVLPSTHRAVSQPIQGIPVRGATLGPQATTLIEVLRAAGWDTGMWSNNPNIQPDRGFDQGARHFVDYFHHPDRTVDFDPGRAERMLPHVEQWLAEGRDNERPFCAYVHIMDPHYPYVAPAPFQGKFDQSGSDFQLLGPLIDEYREGKRDLDEITPEMIKRIVDIYDEELLYVDHFLGPFLDKVRSEHPNTIVVVLGDHGEEFLEHGSLGHGHSLYEELTHVPLLIYGPGLEPRRVPAQVRLMDVYPTVLELVGVRPPPGLHGESLVPVMDGSETADRLAPMENGGDERPPWQLRALSDGHYKMIRREKDLPTRKPVAPLTKEGVPEARPYWYLFDLETDPDELTNRYREDKERAEALFETMEANGWWKSPEEISGFKAQIGDFGSDLDHLKAIGYAGEEDGEQDGTE